VNYVHKTAALVFLQDAQAVHVEGLAAVEAEEAAAQYATGTTPAQIGQNACLIALRQENAWIIMLAKSYIKGR
jgi:hypothetical protein